MQKTSNYNLNKPEATDPLRVADFNENAEILDAALNTINTAVPRIVTGTYTGDGAVSRTINLGFTPNAVLVVNARGQMYSANYYTGGLAVFDSPVEADEYKVIECVNGGFRVYYGAMAGSNSYLFTNADAVKYHYLAIG